MVGLVPTIHVFPNPAGCSSRKRCCPPSEPQDVDISHKGEHDGRGHADFGLNQDNRR
jgi:hypothetical protein